MKEKKKNLQIPEGETLSKGTSSGYGKEVILKVFLYLDSWRKLAASKKDRRFKSPKIVWHTVQESSLLVKQWWKRKTRLHDQNSLRIKTRPAFLSVTVVQNERRFNVYESELGSLEGSSGLTSPVKTFFSILEHSMSCEGLVSCMGDRVYEGVDMKPCSAMQHVKGTDVVAMNRNSFVSKENTLITIDANLHGGFSIPSRAIEGYLPPLDHTAYKDSHGGLGERTYIDHRLFRLQESLGNSSDESSILRERFLNDFVPNDACPLGTQLSVEITGYMDQFGLKDDKHSDMVDIPLFTIDTDVLACGLETQANPDAHQQPKIALRSSNT
ncbi:hypothetical protein VNO77_03725 [Canavalia gladiata]|uniref:Uncharacterized protein n=1 Tax=Canavalia gladiata TaxID=3824 RepID=A0AAN9R8E6_CANGL